MKRFITLTLFAFFLALNVQAQRNCSAMELLEQQLLDDPKLQIKMDRIEQETQMFIKRKSSLRAEGIVTIPVVVHVVYNTSAENISQAQILSQIDILNEDFRRLNADASNTPSVFQGVAADSEIEFCLATVDPNGNPTDGITRTSTTNSSFSTNNTVKFNSSGGKDAWPADDYLNIWVCDISGSILGYAQFPGGSPSTDGVVNDYQYFGNIGTATAPFDLGRTLTHEVGHFLNLRHIWGDGGCAVDDFVSDTPTAGGPNTNGIPCVFDGTLNSCGSGGGDLPDMFQNYMDYSDDGCMNLFTEGQKSRMRAVLDAGGVRASLAASTKCGIPAEPTCTDGIQNGDETGIDCGGANCPDCPAEPSCTDGVQNGNETGVDCGGPDCAPCPCNGTNANITIKLDNYPEETAWTLTNSDGTTVASGGTYGSQADGSTVSIDLCLADGCYDFRITDSYGDGICCAYGNGAYTVTAGGSTVASGGNFSSSETTNFCVGGNATSCTDGIQNGQETGIDCGGPDCPDCPVLPTCTDGVQNGQETGVDCGGPDCPDCPVLPTCTDGVQNGQETGIDCGGPDCAPCNTGECTTTNIDFNDFESGYGIWNDGGSDCARNGASSYAFSGTRTIRLRDNSNSSVTTTDDLALANYEEVTIDFTYIARSMEQGEDFWLQASTDGGSSYTTLASWARGTDFSNNSREFESVTITGTFTNNTRFRFRCDASTNADYIYLDDINISGCANASKESVREPVVANIVHKEISKVNVYPNPAYDRLNIEYALNLEAEVKINVVDMAGRRVMTTSRDARAGVNTIKLQTGNLGKGIYYLHISNGEEQIIKKFAVMK